MNQQGFNGQMNQVQPQSQTPYYPNMPMVEEEKKFLRKKFS